MNEQELAQIIARRLDDGAAELDQNTLARLQTAREQALALYPSTRPAYGLAASGHHFGEHHAWFGGARWLAPVLALVLGVAAVAYWQAAPQNGDNDIDSELLADDLPVHAYTNYILEGWIKHASQ